MQMGFFFVVFFFVVGVTLSRLRSTALIYVTVLYRKIGRRVPGLFCRSHVGKVQWADEVMRRTKNEISTTKVCLVCLTWLYGLFLRTLIPARYKRIRRLR